MRQLTTLKPRFRGPAGKEVLLQAGLTHLQWMLQGDSTWQNLASLDALAPGKMPVSGGIFTGNIQVKNVVETLTEVTIYSGTAVIDLSQGNVFNLSLSENVIALNINTLPAGDVNAFTLIVTQNNTEAKTLYWAGSNIPIKWPDSATPLVTTTLDKVDVFSFMSIDQGDSFFGFVGGQAY
jgi:hypothetical protein